MRHHSVVSCKVMTLQVALSQGWPSITSWRRTWRNVTSDSISQWIESLRLLSSISRGHIPRHSSRIPIMPLLSLISSRLQPCVFVRSGAPLPSTPGSDQCSLSRSLVVRCSKPLGTARILILPPLEKPGTCPIKLLPPATPIRRQIWSSHLASRRLPSHSVPRVPEDAVERQGKIVSWLPARGKRGEGFWNI